jgi:hypothetical protein
MSKAIPLSTTLRIKSIFVVVGHVLHKRLDLMLKGFSTEAGNFWDVQWQAESPVLAG